VVGLKPTYGLVSRRGVYPLSFSLDHCGPITWSVEDAAISLNVIAGHDPLDPSSAKRQVCDYTSKLTRGINGLRIGYARSLFALGSDVSEDVIRVIDGAAQMLAQLGAVIEEIHIPAFDLFRACGRILMLAEAYAIHEQNIRTRPRDYGRYMFQRVAPAATLSAADIIQAQRLRRELTVAVNELWLSQFDVLITTTALTPAARLTEFPLNWPPPSSTIAVQTVPFNVTGNPALSVPAGFSKDGLPLGLQIVGRPFDEVTVFQVASAFEAIVGISGVHPDPGTSLSGF
jgi:aspartyl-tRNA(Asn)/glutamyl-tRNA(Gln) amidotransferase subunit A